MHTKKIVQSIQLASLEQESNVSFFRMPAHMMAELLQKLYKMYDNAPGWYIHQLAYPSSNIYRTLLGHLEAV